jgi:hypothetical protein
MFSAALGVHAWLDRDGTRPPIRAALVRYWTRHRLFRWPVPLTGAASLRAETPWEFSAWAEAFMTALIERRSIDYSELEGAMAHLELAIRDTRRRLDVLARRGRTRRQGSRGTRFRLGAGGSENG